MIFLRYQARTGYWFVDIGTGFFGPKNKAHRGLWTGPWLTARGAMKLDMRAGT